MRPKRSHHHASSPPSRTTPLGETLTIVPVLGIGKGRKRKPQREEQLSPVPEPYLALAPQSVTAAQASGSSSSSLILPSTYVKTRSGSRDLGRSPTPTGSRGGYAANLLSPPTIMGGGSSGSGSRSNTPQPSRPGYAANLASPPSILPGGRPNPPLLQHSSPFLRPTTSHSRSNSAQLNILNGGERSESPLPPNPDDRAERDQERDRNRRRERANASPTPGASRPNPRRRRRIVNSQDSSRRVTVSSAEEGRGLARRASQRRVNVWDGDYLVDTPEMITPS